LLKKGKIPQPKTLESFRKEKKKKKNKVTDLLAEKEKRRNESGCPSPGKRKGYEISQTKEREGPWKTSGRKVRHSRKRGRPEERNGLNSRVA